MSKIISIIVAVAENNGIGFNNKLLAYISADLKRFKEITSGHTIVMGRNTFLSLPKGALPNRINIVISQDKDEQFPNCVMVNSIEEAIDKCPEGDESFIIGGAMVYKQFYPIANCIYLTKIHKSFSADTFFPEIESEKWNILKSFRIDNDSKVDFSYSFIDMERKK